MRKLSLKFMLCLSLILTMRSGISSAEVNLIPNLDREQKEAIVVCKRELSYCRYDIEIIAHPPTFEWKTAIMSFLVGAVSAFVIKDKLAH